MNLLRIFLPIYKEIISKFSKGKGYGKNRYIKKILDAMDKIFRDEFVIVYGHKMHLPKYGFDIYSTKGIYGELDTLTVEKIVNKGDYVVDIGAAIGYYTLILSRIVGNDGKVFSFEPKKDRFELLKENISLNGYDNVETLNNAIFPKDKSPQFFKPKGEKGGLRHLEKKQSTHIEKIDVITIDLDSFFKNLKLNEKISFVKIDVDGSELFVLQSMLSILKNKNLTLFLEWDMDASKRSGCEPLEILNILKKFDFRIFYPNYTQNKYFLINVDELPLLTSNNTINLVCTKNSELIL